MTDAALEMIFRTQAARLWQSFAADWQVFVLAGGRTPDRAAALASPALTALLLPLHTLKGSALGLDRLPLAQACHDLESTLAAWRQAPDAESWAALVAVESLLRPQWLAAAGLVAGATTAGGPEAGAAAGAADLAALHEAVAVFVRRTSAQCGVPATWEIRLAPGWLAEQALLWDALPHLVRNVFSHGREPAARRFALGKPEALSLRIRAHASRAGLRLLVADDGAGVAAARAEADLWAGRGQGVPAVRAALTARAGSGGRVSLRWRGRAGRGALARACIFFF